jgi:hypothetical protein
VRTNPEFRRNLWLEFSPVRLVAMPLVLGLAFAATWLVDRDWGDVAGTALWLYGLLAFVWGTYRAAAALGEEVNAHTWDAQRISSLGAWSMTWGKLLGATAYVWYGALICLAVRLVALGLAPESAGGPLLPVLLAHVGLVFQALLAQALALGLALALHRKRRPGGALPVFLCQIGGLLAALIGAQTLGLPLLSPIGPLAGAIDWFGLGLPPVPFTVAAGVVFAGWAVVGVHRLMRLELQFRNSPLVLVGFFAFLVVFLEGYVVAECNRTGYCAGEVMPWLLPVIGVAAAMVYVTLFLEPKDAVAWRAALAAAGRGRFDRLATGLPMWIAPLLAGAAAVAVLCVLAVTSEVEGAALRFMARFGIDTGLRVWPVFVAGFLFVLRDIGIVLFCNFRRGARRPDLTALVVLVVLYVVVGGLLAAGPGGAWQALARPWPAGDPLLTMAPPLIQAVVIWGAALWRGARLTRIAPGAPAVQGA